MPKQTVFRDPVSGLTHLVACALSVIGLIVMLIQQRGAVAKQAVAGIYGASLILLYLASSVYHLVNASPRVVAILRKVDHSSIFILIAGCDTPVFAFGLQGRWRIAMLISTWTIALAGVTLKLCTMKAPRWLSTGLYLFMGWIAIIPLWQLVHALPSAAFALLFAGGIVYTLGAVIYATKWPNFLRKGFGFHELFHLFIIAGSVLHFIMIQRYILPL